MLNIVKESKHSETINVKTKNHRQGHGIIFAPAQAFIAVWVTVLFIMVSAWVTLCFLLADLETFLPHWSLALD